MVPKLKASIGVSDDSKFIAKLIKVTPDWLTFKEPGKRPWRIRKNELKSFTVLDTPEEIQVHIMKEMIESVQPGYKKPGVIRPVSYH